MVAWGGGTVSNVASLFGGPTGQAEPNETCIAALRDLLARAEAGEIIGIAMASLEKDGKSGFVVAGHVGGYSMIGALEMARAELIEVARD